MPDFDDYHAFKSTSGGSDNNSGNGGSGIGCLAWIVVGIVIIMLIYFIADGASWDAIDGLLGFGVIAFLIARALFR